MFTLLSCKCLASRHSINQHYITGMQVFSFKALYKSALHYLFRTSTGVDPMGLFWSMAPLPDHPQNVRLVIRDVTKPLVINIAVFDGHVTPSDDTVAMTSWKPLCITEVQRTFLAPGVRRIEVRKGRVRGTLFLPPGEFLVNDSEMSR